MQDVITRWWSTYAMLLRLWSLRKYLDGLEESKVIENNLKMVEWGKVQQIIEVLQPFQQVQQLLEGEHYVTISLYPALITLIRTKLEKQASNAALDDDVKGLAGELLVDFNQRWGDGSLNSEWGVVRGDKRRLEGVRYTAYVAALLDPRTKKGIMKTFGSEDMDKLTAYVLERMKVVNVDMAPGVVRVPTAASTLSPAQKELQEALGGGGARRTRKGTPSRGTSRTSSPGTCVRRQCPCSTLSGSTPTRCRGGKRRRRCIRVSTRWRWRSCKLRPLPLPQSARFPRQVLPSRKTAQVCCPKTRECSCFFEVRGRLRTTLMILTKGGGGGINETMNIYIMRRKS